MRLELVFLTSLAVGYSGALMPGPLLTMVVAQSAQRGPLVGPLAIAGHALLELILLGGLAAGLTQFLSLPLVSCLIGVIGGAVMLWMGGTMLREAVGDKLDLGLRPAQAVADPGEIGKVPASRRWSTHVLSGALITFSNPYWSLWWATVGAAYVMAAAALGILGIVAFFIGHVIADFSWYALVSYSVAYGRRFLGHQFYRILIGACGLFLVGLASYFMVGGLRGLS